MALRVFDGASNGGMYGGQPTGIEKDGQLLQDLSGDWKYLPTAILSNNKFSVFTAEQPFEAMPRPPLEINSHLPTGLYNAMIHPLVPFSIKGTIWYQGENNVSRAEQYKTLFPAMIQSWRNKWGKDFPFYFTQIAPYAYSGKDNVESAELRNAQNQTLSLTKTGQAVTLDIGSLETIHPPNKEDVGERLARWALAKDYKQKSVAFSGPVCSAATLKGDKIILDFNIGSTSLVAGKLGLKEFELVFKDGSIQEVSASIQGNKIRLENPTGNTPTAVRYAWKNGSEASLFNSAGLPASTFHIRLK
jgi:sialate O-acetylesterase